jgi:predicted DNA-binding transcriptional regulator AlpA
VTGEPKIGHGITLKFLPLLVCARGALRASRQLLYTATRASEPEFNGKTGAAIASRCLKKGPDAMSNHVFQGHNKKRQSTPDDMCGLRALTAEQTATLLGYTFVSRSRRQQLVERGDFPRESYRLRSGSPRWLLKDIAAWQAAQKEAAPQRIAAASAHGRKAIAARYVKAAPAPTAP